jgi:hypothetical protein
MLTPLISVLDSIVIEYLDVQDNDKLIQLFPQVYSWGKYCRGRELPDIYDDAIDRCNSVSLVEYLLPKQTDRFNFFETRIRSVHITKWLLERLHPTRAEYAYLIRSAIYDDNAALFDYLWDLQLYSLDVEVWGIISAIMYPMHIQEKVREKCLTIMTEEEFNNYVVRYESMIHSQV